MRGRWRAGVRWMEWGFRVGWGWAGEEYGEEGAWVGRSMGGEEHGQGGAWAGRSMGGISKVRRSQGVRGIGETGWGPGFEEMRA